MSGDIVSELSQAFPHLVFAQHAALAPHTYMKVGGIADVFVHIKHAKDLHTLVSYCSSHDIPCTVLGGASNVLISDEGLRGVVIKNQSAEIEIVKGEHAALVTVDSGVPTNVLVRRTLNEGLEGLEYFLGVPGTVGGAIYNNSHYMSELIGNYVKTVEIFSRKEQVLKTLTKQDMQFAYDFSVLQHTHDIVLRVTFELAYGDKEKLEAKAQEITKKRANTQPLGQPSSGCMFKNVHKPNGEVLHAGQLIDQAGLKGYRIGDAMVSDVHANFIINTGHATHRDIAQLASYVQNIIKEKYGVELEKEVFMLE